MLTSLILRLLPKFSTVTFQMTLIIRNWLKTIIKKNLLVSYQRYFMTMMHAIWIFTRPAYFNQRACEIQCLRLHIFNLYIYIYIFNTKILQFLKITTLFWSDIKFVFVVQRDDSGLNFLSFIQNGLVESAVIGKILC